VLEIGAGLGNITIQLLPRDQYFVTDIDALHVSVLKALAERYPGVKVLRMDARRPEDFAPVRGAVDTVVCLNVLEHLSDPQAALRNMYAALQPGGRAIILVPQGRWLYSSLDKALGHVTRYTRRSLAEALTAAGFEVEKAFNFNRIGVAGWALNGKILRRKRMAKYQLKMFDSLVWLWRRTDWLLPWPGLSLVMIARKPPQA
jgi:SAM-dependent methyltransferase